MRKLFDRVRSRQRTTPVRLVLMLIGLAFPAWQAIAAGSEEPGGLYSEVQAARGESLYQQHCSACHGARLQGSPAAPLTGDAFRARWEDGRHTLDDLYYIIRSLMPNNAPGSLSKAQYSDVVAYILKVNGYPAGGAELVPTAAAMKAVTLQPH
jgi:mono/diheme cytochrome c family protein